ncbi:lipopolysaccharide transport periplasmic protein LptA [Vibrio sp. S4M6]|uniref:lipopolysaccharide transport periplasmic protein LptA n=1 Tax=Vibrio sinus TaxID=2946865 RepID=UPI002029EC64|nr:lipopolysaccharide transport periplasmic protein LptA [Vibrio sinus]MCL9782797.1 lipopolysaccharide transport periplasmic protein LptA [Vibrio sinus]
MKATYISLVIALYFYCFQAAALSSDHQQEIHATSKIQRFDLKKRTTTLIGNVIVTQGSIKITSDKAIIIKNLKNNKIDMIIATGKPAKFYQLTDDNKVIRGTAEKFIYKSDKMELELTEKATLSLEKDKIRAPRIHYNIKTETLVANRGHKERVETTIHPKTQ